jgi:PEP-CTERM motif
LGQAGPNQILRYGGGTANGRPFPQIAIAQAGTMQFDTADLGNMLQNGTLENVIRHEMAHVLGIGTLWDDNGLRNTTARGDYIGKHGLAAYRIESKNRFAGVVPIEQLGGPGTAGGHWDSLDPFFNQRAKNNSSELMIGNIGPGEVKFTSETTWGSLRDMWFGFKGDSNVWRVKSRTAFVQPPKRSQFMTAVPEPGSAGVLLIGTVIAAFGFRRRK